MTDNHSIIHNCKTEYKQCISWNIFNLKKSSIDRKIICNKKLNICNIENCVIKYNNCSSIKNNNLKKRYIDLLICSINFKNCNDSSLSFIPNIYDDDDDNIMSRPSNK